MKCALTSLEFSNRVEKGNTIIAPMFRNLIKSCRICRNDEFVTNMYPLDYGLLKGRSVCKKCFEKHSICKSCEERKPIEGFDGNICYDCNTKRNIKYFNCRPHRYLDYFDANCNRIKATKNSVPKTQYYGIELELQINHPDYDPNQKNTDSARATEFKQRIASSVLDVTYPRSAILKHDGTVGYGFELVTAPATFDAHQLLWDEFFDYAFGNGRKKFNLSERCGMHIHVSRDSLTNLQIGKLMSFIYEPKNRTFIYKIAERPNNHYADLNLNKKITDVLKPSGTKYEAINLNNKHTIEIRIFQAPITKEGFFKNLEFFDCLLEYVKNHSIAMASDLEAFKKFLNTNKETYPNLFKFLN